MEIQIPKGLGMPLNEQAGDKSRIHMPLVNAHLPCWPHMYIQFMVAMKPENNCSIVLIMEFQGRWGQSGAYITTA